MPSAPINVNLADSGAAAAQAAGMVKQLMQFSGQSRQEHIIFELRTFIGDITKICCGIFDRRISIEFKHGSRSIGAHF